VHEPAIVPGRARVFCHPPATVFASRAPDMEQAMMDVLHWVGVGLGFLVIGFALVGFWRGLSLKPTDPASRAPERPTWLIGRF
jgi:hypothetical protein